MMACAENKGLNAAKSRLDNFTYKKQPFSTLPAGGTAAFIFMCSLCLYVDKSVFCFIRVANGSAYLGYINGCDPECSAVRRAGANPRGL